MNRANLRVETNALASKVLFEGKRAVGVRYRKGGRNGTPMEVRARKEVIDRLRDKGITIDQLTERVIELELANLERAFRDVVEEFEKAEARGRAKPLGGPGPWGKFDDDDRDR